ncbi:MliC family protein [Cellvibrio fontiphilus]|uniref:MliC family protein n=1 Tax=Cellvibrio fontiphilus TaxID=1815559 RepID=A0ABV7FA89_9GAMM
MSIRSISIGTVSIGAMNTLACISLTLLLAGCSKEPAPTPTPQDAPLIDYTAKKTMHPSWDANQDGMNDCEDDGTCDDSVDYTQPRPSAAAPAADNAQRGPFRFVCTDAAQSEFTALFHNDLNDPANNRLHLSHQGETRELTAVPAASGSKYEGSNASFWEHQGEASIQWQPDTTHQCAPAR